jgi:WD40 repeat protein
MPSARRILYGISLSLILTACLKQPVTRTQQADIPTALPTSSMGSVGTPEVPIRPSPMQTPYGNEEAEASSSPDAPTPTQSPTPIRQSVISFPWTPTRADTALPTGAVAQLGIGKLEVESLSPSGEFLVVNINESTVMLQAMTLRRMWRARHPGLVTWLADGKRVGIGSVLYDAVTGMELASLPVNAERVAWSPDGTLASTHDGGGLMVMWDVATGKQIWSIPRPAYIRQHPGTGYYGWTVEMRFSPDGENIAATYSWGVGDVGADDDRAHVFSARTGGLVAELLEAEVIFWPRLTWSPTGHYLAMGSYYVQGVTVWDIVSGKPLMVNNANSVNTIAWSPDGCRFATGVYGVVTIWDCTTGEALSQFNMPDVEFTALSWSRDGSLLAGGSDWTPSVAVWEVSTGEVVHSIESGGRLIGFGTDNQTIIGGLGMQNSVALWTLDVPTPAQPTAYLRGLSGINSLAWSPDGSQIASTAGIHRGQRAGLIAWDVAHGSPIFDLEGDAYVDWMGIVDADNIHVAWSPENALVALSSVGKYGETSEVSLIDIASSEVIYQLQNVTGLQAEFSPDGSLLAVRNASGDVSLYPVATWVRREQTLPGGGRVVMDFAWSPDGSQIAVASVENDDVWASDDPSGRVDVWDTASLEKRYTLEGLNGPALSVAWSPDGRRIAASNNTNVAIWSTGADKATPDLMLYSLIKRSEGSRMGLTEIDWSPDGALIVGAYGMPYTRFYCNGCGYGDAGLVIVWDATTAERLYRFEAHTDEVQTVAFSPDGALLASGSLDGIIYIWDLHR